MTVFFVLIVVLKSFTKDQCVYGGVSSFLTIKNDATASERMVCMCGESCFAVGVFSAQTPAERNKMSPPDYISFFECESMVPRGYDPKKWDQMKRKAKRQTEGRKNIFK